MVTKPGLIIRDETGVEHFRLALFFPLKGVKTELWIPLNSMATRQRIMLSICKSRIISFRNRITLIKTATASQHSG